MIHPSTKIIPILKYVFGLNLPGKEAALPYRTAIHYQLQNQDYNTLRTFCNLSDIQ